MPGVPSGKGCDACRKQKKKCDEVKPTCGRCTRLSLTCIGSGQQRFKFKDQSAWQIPKGKSGGKKATSSGSASPKSSSSSSSTSSASASKSTSSEEAVMHVTSAPSSELSIMLSAFIQSIGVTTDLRYNLLWSYGGYLVFIPQRLGRNEALDASVRALITTHSDYALHRQKVGVNTLNMYSKALQTLRSCLNDPSKACSSETLCAVMVLMISQALIGLRGQRWTGHCEGAAQMLKARGYYNSQDPFERTMLLSLRGSVLFEALFNSKIQFTAQEWKILVQNELDRGNPESEMMHSMSKIPDLLRRGRKWRRGISIDPELPADIVAGYEESKAVLKSLTDRLATIHEPELNGKNLLAFPGRMYALHERSYGLGLVLAIMYNCMVGAVDAGQEQLLCVEATHYSQEIIAIAEHSVQYRPLGSSYVIACLVGACVGPTDESTKAQAELILEDYTSDFAQDENMTRPDHIECLRQRLSFNDVDEADDLGL